MLAILWGRSFFRAIDAGAEGEYAAARHVHGKEKTVTEGRLPRGTRCLMGYYRALTASARAGLGCLVTLAGTARTDLQSPPCALEGSSCCQHGTQRRVCCP